MQSNSCVYTVHINVCGKACLNDAQIMYEQNLVLIQTSLRLLGQSSNLLYLRVLILCSSQVPIKILIDTRPTHSFLFCVLPLCVALLMVMRLIKDLKEVV